MLFHIDPLRLWVHKVLPVVYDDSLSYYEVLAKVTKKLNEVIDLTEEQNQFIQNFSDNLTNAINSWEEGMENDWSKYRNDLNNEWTDFQKNTEQYIENWKNMAESDIEDAIAAGINQFVSYFSDLTQTAVDAAEEAMRAAENAAQDAVDAIIPTLENQFDERYAWKTAVGSPLVATTAAGMTDTTKVYVYVGSESGYVNGDWYYYDGTAWQDGGVYNSAAVETDTTLSEAGVPADAKATGDEIGELKGAISATPKTSTVVWRQGSIVGTNGTDDTTQSARISTVDYIPNNITFIKAINGYTFCIAAYEPDGTYYGRMKTDGKFAKNDSGILWTDRFCPDYYPKTSSTVATEGTLKRYKITLRRSDPTEEISISEGVNAIFYDWDNIGETVNNNSNRHGKNIEWFNSAVVDGNGYTRYSTYGQTTRFCMAFANRSNIAGVYTDADNIIFQCRENTFTDGNLVLNDKATAQVQTYKLSGNSAEEYIIIGGQYIDNSEVDMDYVKAHMFICNKEQYANRPYQYIYDGKHISTEINTVSEIFGATMESVTSSGARQGSDIYGNTLFTMLSDDKIATFNHDTGELLNVISNTESGHGGSVQFSGIFYDPADSFPLLFTIRNAEHIIKGLRVTADSCQTIYNVDVGINYHMMVSFDAESNFLYTLHYPDGGEFPFTNATHAVLNCWNMGNLTINQNNTVTPQNVFTKIVPAIYAPQDCKYYRGKMFIISSVTYGSSQYIHGTYIYCLDIASGTIETVFKNFSDRISHTEIESIFYYPKNGKIMFEVLPLTGQGYILDIK